MATKLREKLVQLKELAGLLMNSRQEVVQTQSAVYQALMGFQQFQADQWEPSVNDLIASNEKRSQRCMEQQLVISALEQQLSSCQSCFDDIYDRFAQSLGFCRCRNMGMVLRSSLVAFASQFIGILRIQIVVC
jgi:hypothetical protein